MKEYCQGKVSSNVSRFRKGRKCCRGTRVRRGREGEACAYLSLLILGLGRSHPRWPSRGQLPADVALSSLKDPLRHTETRSSENQGVQARDVSRRSASVLGQTFVRFLPTGPNCPDPCAGPTLDAVPSKT
jgi:hypothetical protein